MVRVSIVGATGMVGEGLIRAVLGHPDCKLALLVSERTAGEPISKHLPGLRSECELQTVAASPAEVAAASDIVFNAKKGTESFDWIPGLVEAGARIVDMGGEFRFRDKSIYEQWYKEQHGCPDYLEQAVYGLPECFKDEIRAARIVGNPGCYVTSATLALIPLVKAGLIEDEGIAIDSYSGLTGAGRQYNAKASNLFVDIDENMRAYSVGNHKHTPEIENNLGRVVGRSLKVTFIPHLVPLNRGILTTIFARPASGVKTAELLAAMRAYHTRENSPFVRVLDQVDEVAIANVAYTNYCDISAQVVERTRQVVIASSLDNLVKGASGQALQNLNIMCGLPETAGLRGRSL